LDDRQAPSLQQPARVGHRRVQTDLVVDLDQLVPGQAQNLAVLGVALVLEGHHRIDAVVAPVQFEDDEHAAVAPRRGGSGRAGQEDRHRRRQGQQG
jgi:hypothetical protein